jgi:hypothetical protein
VGREVSYEDAVKLLGGDTAKIVRLADTLVGVGLLAATGPFQEVLSWFDAKAELTKVTEHLVTSLADRRSGLSRFERTERLQDRRKVPILGDVVRDGAELHDPRSRARVEDRPKAA